MSETERRNAEKTLRDDQRELARKQNEFLEDLNVRRNEALGQLQRTVLQEVQTYAKSAGLDVVVADALYASASVDITNQVLAALQAPQGPGAPPSPEARAAGRARPCRCGSPSWPSASAANCGAIPTRSSSASRPCRTRPPARSRSSPTRSTGATLRTTRASAVVLDAAAADDCPVAALIAAQSLRDLRPHRAAAVSSPGIRAGPAPERRDRGRRVGRRDGVGRRRMPASRAAR